MNKIVKINLPRMNNGAHFTFVSNILARAEADKTVNGKARELVSKLKAAVDNEDSAMNVSRKSFFTDAITQANNKRDSLYKAYRRVVNAFLCMPVADMAEAARVLSQHIKDYRISPRDQLDKKTGLMVNFIDDLEHRHSAQVEKLGLTVFVTQMKEANEQVRTSTLQRTHERMGKTVGAMKKARAAADDAYRALVKMVNALALIYGENDYSSFIDYVNAEIAHYKREVISQKTAAATNQPADSPATDSESNSTRAGNDASSSNGSSSDGDSSSNSGGTSSDDGDTPSNRGNTTSDNEDMSSGSDNASSDSNPSPDDDDGGMS